MATTASRLALLQRKPTRICITLNAALLERLNALALEQGRSLSNLAAFTLETALTADRSPCR